MFESLRSNLLWYWNDYLLRIPSYIFQMLISMTSLGVVLLLSWKGLWRGIELTGRLLLLELMFIIYCSTIIFRAPNHEVAYNLIPFWSYKVILNGVYFLLAENIMNVLIFIPVGLLIGIGFSKMQWWKAIGFGCLISISIEVLQFAFKRGFCEVDDVMHNTFGCAIGYAVVKMIARSGFMK